MNTKSESKELEFLRLYKDFIYYFNMLERNLAYFLRHIGAIRIKGVEWEAVFKLSFDEKLRKLELTAKPVFKEGGVAEWFESAGACRVMRNSVVHGSWEFRWHLAEPIRYSVPLPKSTCGSYTLEGFRAELERLQKVSTEFTPLRRRIEESISMAQERAKSVASPMNAKGHKGRQRSDSRAPSLPLLGTAYRAGGRLGRSGRR